MDTVKQVARSFEPSAKVAQLYQKRTKIAQDHFRERLTRAYADCATALVENPVAPTDARSNWKRYSTDFAQRSILFWNTLRERGNNFIEHNRDGLTPVLHFDFETVVDGRFAMSYHGANKVIPTYSYAVRAAAVRRDVVRRWRCQHHGVTAPRIGVESRSGNIDLSEGSRMERLSSANIERRRLGARRNPLQENPVPMHASGARISASMLALAALVFASGAHASFLPPEVMDSAAMYLAWFVIIFVPIGAIVLFWLVHIMPEKIAHKRHHPQRDAIQVLCLLSLVFGGLLWPIAWLWAYTRPAGYKLAYGTEKHEDYFHDMGEKAQAGELLEHELAHLRDELDLMAAKGTLDPKLRQLRSDLAEVPTAPMPAGAAGAKAGAA